MKADGIIRFNPELWNAQHHRARKLLRLARFRANKRRYRQRMRLARNLRTDAKVQRSGWRSGWRSTCTAH